MELKGKTAIVTGSGRGIGRELALEFARQGANVVVCARSEDQIRRTAELIEQAGGVAAAVPTDITDPRQVDRLLAETLKKFGRAHLLFNNAGSFACIGPLWEIDPEVWWRDVTVNLRGLMLCCAAALKHMIAHDEGIIINMTGGGAESAIAGGTGYSCSKAAVVRLTDGIAKELASIGSNVCAFVMGPGFVRTEMTEYQAETPEGRKWLPGSKAKLQSGRGRPPQDCAKAAVKLIKIACPQLNGQAFSVGTDFEKVKQQLG